MPKSNDRGVDFSEDSREDDESGPLSSSLNSGMLSNSLIPEESNLDSNFVRYLKQSDSGSRKRALHSILKKFHERIDKRDVSLLHHLRTFIRLAYNCPFDSIRKGFKELLEKLRVRNIIFNLLS